MHMLRTVSPSTARWQRTLVAVAFAVTTLVGPTGLAEATSPPAAPEVYEERVEVDPEFCDWYAHVLRRYAKDHPNKLTGEQRRSMAGEPDCYGVLSHSFTPDDGSTAFNVQQAAAATYCGDRNAVFALYAFGWEGAHARVFTRTCWDRVDDVWNNNYQNCYMTAVGLVMTGSTYCGFWNAWTPRMTYKFDYKFAPYFAPWWWRHGTMQFTVNHLGTQGGTTGSCCW